METTENMEEQKWNGKLMRSLISKLNFKKSLHILNVTYEVKNRWALLCVQQNRMFFKNSLHQDYYICIVEIKVLRCLVKKLSKLN